MLAIDTIEKLSNFLNFDIDLYFNEYFSFIDSDLPKLQDFYLGNIENKDQESQSRLNYLYQKGKELDNLLQIHLHNFNRGDFVELTEYIDEIYYNIKKFNIMSKFLKSSLTDKIKSNTITTERVVHNFETPEVVSEKEREDWMDNWVDLYVKNRKLESDYEYNEGYLIQLNKSIFTNFTLESVIDNLQGDKLFGKDIDVNFDIEDNDIKTLNPIDTFHQSVKIISKLKKRDIPQFPEIGLDQNLINGFFEVNLPLIVREKQKDFSIDDTMLSFSIKSIEKKEGKLYLDFEIQSFYSTTSNFPVQI